jgi:hypothetical protein
MAGEKAHGERVSEIPGPAWDPKSHGFLDFGIKKVTFESDSSPDKDLLEVIIKETK